MKRIAYLLTTIIFICSNSWSQSIVYSDIDKDDNRDVLFEIVGKIGQNYVVYKNVRWRHNLHVFDNNMHTLSNDRLKFMQENTINVDFIAYPDFFHMIYQYEKNNIVYCKLVSFDQNGKLLKGPIHLDSTKVYSARNKIYTTVHSEDKKKILVYKSIDRHNMLTAVTKVYDANMQMLDSTRVIVRYDDRKELYSDLQIANDGNIISAHAVKSGIRENIDELYLLTLKPGDKEWLSHRLMLDKKYIDELKIKIDNLNNNYIFNSFYYEQSRGNIKGLYAAVMDKSTNAVRSVFSPMHDSLRDKVSATGQYRAAFDNLFLRNVFLKKDGSFLLVAEDFSMQTRGYNSWNRWDFLYNSPYDYYNTSYYPYYRNYRYSNVTSTRYFYDNMLVMGVDSSLKLTWNKIIFKNQSDDDNEDYLSFATMNAGGEIHFLFIEKERTSQIISNHSISPKGTLFRYPTLKSREAGYLFMPRHARQTGARQLIVPCMYRGYMSFAKVDF